ncbi:MAG: hypothetical protein WC373_04645 [Smithella sp.]|jgi:predicted Zn-ribbon and HTH transcriptional regulator
MPTKKKKEIPQEAGTCPGCGEGSLRYCRPKFDGDMIGFPWRCPDCKRQGVEWHALTFVEHEINE